MEQEEEDMVAVVMVETLGEWTTGGSVVVIRCWNTEEVRWSHGDGGSGVVNVRYQRSPLTDIAKATGGAISFYGGKTIHTFTSPGTFTVPSPSGLSQVECLAVGGGGGGGQYNAGGGGAGGLVYDATASVSAQAYSITVGAGGDGGAGGAYDTGSKWNGSSTTDISK